MERDVLRYILSKEKAMEVLATLSREAKGKRELRRAIGGAPGTIQKRASELSELGLILEKEIWSKEETRSDYVRPTLSLDLSDKGRETVERLKHLGLWEEPLVPWDREKWIILDLYSLGTINGRTRFMKLLFLQYNESRMIVRDLFYKFEPWDYGPFSKQVYEDGEELKHDGLLTIKQHTYNTNGLRQRTLWIHSLTEKGADVAQKLLKKLPPDTENTIRGMLKRFNEMALFELLRYVYDKYPRYVTRSLIDWKEECEF